MESEENIENTVEPGKEVEMDTNGKFSSVVLLISVF
jgi:hypothetical protein